jgi:hypothetical protein
MTRSVTGTGRLMMAAAAELTQARLWLPAAFLLLPPLLLQLAFPHLLRTRLAPSIAPVVIGSMLIVWWTQIAAAASWGWVDAVRCGYVVQWPTLLRTAVRIGTMTMVGLVCGVIPGVWLQARLGHVLLQRPASDSGEPKQPAIWPLFGVAAATLLVSLLGQSLAAGLAEALDTIVPVDVVGGHVQFRLNYEPHLLTSLVAYAWSAFALTWQAVSVSLASYHEASADREAIRAVARPSQARLTAVSLAVLVVLVSGLFAAFGKLQPHLH